MTKRKCRKAPSYLLLHICRTTLDTNLAHHELKNANKLLTKNHHHLITLLSSPNRLYTPPNFTTLLQTHQERRFHRWIGDWRISSERAIRIRNPFYYDQSRKKIHGTNIIDKFIYTVHIIIYYLLLSSTYLNIQFHFYSEPLILLSTKQKYHMNWILFPTYNFRIVRQTPIMTFKYNILTEQKIIAMAKIID